MRNQKGMALVTLLAFLALAMLLFAGMITAIQTSMARDKTEFVDEQVLLMAQSHMEVAKDELLKKAIMEEIIHEIDGVLLSSTYEDIETNVTYELTDYEGNCELWNDVETCVYPMNLASTSSMRGVSRTLKVRTEIIKTTTMSGAPKEVLEAVTHTLNIEKISKNSHQELVQGTPSRITSRDQRKVFVTIAGGVYVRARSDELPVFIEKEDFQDYESCGYGVIENSCLFSSDVKGKSLVVKPSENEIIHLVITKDIEFDEVNLINAGGANSAVVLIIMDGKTLTFHDSTFLNDDVAITSSKQNMIISKANSPLVLDVLEMEGLIYTPNATIELGEDLKVMNDVIGVVITDSFDYPKEQDEGEGLFITHGNINLSMLCKAGTFCPFIEGNENEEDDGMIETKVVSYTLGEFKYVK